MKQSRFLGQQQISTKSRDDGRKVIEKCINEHHKLKLFGLAEAGELMYIDKEIKRYFR